MTRDDIIRMAREVADKDTVDPFHNGYFTLTLDELERFAALVISHHVKENRPKPNATEREWLQQIAYQHGGIGDLCQTELEFGAMVAAAEREACARLPSEREGRKNEPRRHHQDGIRSGPVRRTRR